MKMTPENYFEGGTVFKDPRTFDQAWYPPWNKYELPCRMDDVRELATFYRPVLNSDGHLMLNTLIIGRGGVGKTILARYFAKMFVDYAKRHNMDMIAEYIDCNEHQTKNAILRHILMRLKLSTGRGYSDSELHRQLVSYLKSTGRYLFLILDEIHKLDHDDLLSFLNASITFGYHNVRMSIMCISRAYDWLSYRTERITSRIQKIYKLEPYNFKQAYEILSFRARLAFVDGTFPENVLQMIARIVEREKNMRVGIELMRQTAHYLDKNGLKTATPEIIRKAAGEIVVNYDINLLDFIKGEHNMAIMLGVARYFEHHPEAEYMTTQQIFDEYSVVCEEYGITPKKFPTVKRYIKDLVDRKILEREYGVPKGKERGREARYSLLEYSAEFLREYLEGELGGMLN